MTVAARPPARFIPMTVLAAILTLSVVAAGCMNDKWPTVPIYCEDPCHLPQTSPANILTNLQVAYADRTIEEYRKLFADDFTFVFCPADTSGDDLTPAQWGLAEELNSTQRMFRDSLVTRIDFGSYVLGVPEQVDPLTYGPRAWRVWVSQANLRVHTRTESSDTLTYVVDGATEAFYFREDPTRVIDGRPVWFIFRWEDQPVGSAKIETKSWGAIKFMFR